MNLSEAISWIADVFQENPDSLKPETEQNDIPGWDSMGVLSLMAGLDNDFDILISPDDMQNVNKVEDILSILKDNGKME